MRQIVFTRGGATLVGHRDGAGFPLVFQHGLGGSEAQVADNVPAVDGFRRLTLDCRAQGASTAGDERPFSIAMFADDVLAFADEAGAQRFVAGGISMGAAIALRLAVRHPERVAALIVARPAWAFAAAPSTMQPYAAVAAALREGSPSVAKARFERSPTAAMLAREAPDNLASLLGVFDRPDPAVTADLLAAIAADGPGVAREEVRALSMPTLVIGHGIDVAHPQPMAEMLASTIPGAVFVEIPPKAGQKAAHVAAFRDAVRDFLTTLARSTELDR